jgi:hypothetical protein
MGRKEQAARLAPYAKELLENEYGREKLREGVEKLGAAYRRSQKRRVEPTRDERLREQLRSATRSLTEAGQALRSGRRKPKPRWGRRAMVIGGLAAAGTAVAVWAKERLHGSTTARPTPSPAAQNPTEPMREPSPA